MSYEPRSIADHIDCLARLTGAPDAFVTQVRELFGKKGISLEEDAAPYLKALEEAFRREESIRFSSSRARHSITSLQKNFQKIGRAYVEQLSQGKRAQTAADGPTRRSRKRVSTIRTGTTQITITGDHRTFVTPMEREELPLVPGPEEVN